MPAKAIGPIIMKLRLLTIFLCVSVLSCAGCFPAPAGSTLAQVDTEIDPLAIVVADVYSEFGQDRIIFLEMIDATEDDETYLALMAKLEAELSVPVFPEALADRSIYPDVPPLTPVDSATGNIGISITIGDIRFDEQGYLVVEVGYARSALDGGVLEYALDDTPDGWVIIAIRLTGIS